MSPRNVCAFGLALLFGMCTAQMAHAQDLQMAQRAPRQGLAPFINAETAPYCRTLCTPLDTVPRVDTLPRVVVRDSAPSLATLRRMNDSLARVEDSLTRRLDSLRHPLPYIKASTAAAFRRAFHPGRWYAGALGTGLAVNWTCPGGLCDRDPGGYPDSWHSFDKVEHFEIAYFLSARALDMSVERRWAVALTCGAAIGWEGTQARGHGFASYRDATASCAGAALPALFDWIKAHRESAGLHR